MLSADAGPVLLTELDAAIGAQANRQDEQTTPDGGDNKSNGEEGESDTWNDEWQGRDDCSGGRCSSVGVRVGRAGGGLGEDAVDKRSIGRRESGCDFFVADRVVGCKINLRNQEALERLPDLMLAEFLEE